MGEEEFILTQLNRFAVQSPAPLPSSQEVTQKTLPSSSNGHQISYNPVEKDERIGSIADANYSSAQAQIHLFGSDHINRTSLEGDTPFHILKSMETIGVFRKNNQGVIGIYAIGNLSASQIKSAAKENRLLKFLNIDGKTVLSGNKEFGELLEANKRAGKPVLLRNPGGTVNEIENFTFQEMSEVDQALLQNAVKIYLIYLKAMEDEQRAKKKSGPDETLFEPSSNRVDSHEKAEKNSFSIRIIMDPSEKPSVSLTNIVMKMIVDQMNAERKKKTEEKKAEERALEKSTFIRREVVAEAVKKELIKKGNIQASFIKSASIIISIADNKFLMLLVLKSSPNTVFRASPKQDQQLDL